MDTSDWITIGMLGATLLLALAAFWAIWQNYTFRKEDRELHFKLKALDDIIDWAHKTRITIVNSLSEWQRYQSDRGSNLQAQSANLEAQLNIQEAKLRTTEKTELVDLDKELRSLSQELKILEGEQLTENDIRVNMISMLAETASEYEFLQRTTHQFGKIFQILIEKIGDILEQTVESLSSGKYEDEKPFFREYGQAVKELGTLLGRLSLEAFALKSLLLKYGSKLKL